METETKSSKHLPLLNEAVRLRTLLSNPQAIGLLVEQAIREHAEQIDDEQMETHRARLAVVRKVGEDVEAEARTLPLVKASQLRDFSQVAIGEAILDFLVSPQGQKIIEAGLVKVRAKAAADRKAIDDLRHAEEARERQQREAKLDSEVAATDPAGMLNVISAMGVSLSVNEDGTKITALPAGRLSHIQRRVIEEKRDQVVSLLRAAQQAETL